MRISTERACWGALAVAMALSAALELYLTRGATYYVDDLMWFVASRGFRLKTLLGPHFGNLMAGTRLIYAAVFKLFGANYLSFRLLEALGLLLVAGLFYVIAKRRVGPIIALALTVPLLFFGPAFEVTLLPQGLQHLYCIAAGLGALLALERDSRRADVLACALLVASVAIYSVGLAFVAGVAVSVLIRRDRASRAWIFLVPLVLYGAWYFIAPSIKGPQFSTASGLALSNLFAAPKFIVKAAGAVAAALTGLSWHFYSAPPQGNVINASWGYPIALAAVVAFGFRLRRRHVSASLWVSLAILLAFWLSTALVAGYNRYPDSGRYQYTATVAVLLVATDALRGIRLSRVPLLALFAIAALSVAANTRLLVAHSRVYRSYSETVRAQLTGVELARDRVAPSFTPAGPIPDRASWALVLIPGHAGEAGQLLPAVRRNGSFAFSVTELQRQSESLRELADQAVTGALALAWRPAPHPPTGTACVRTAPQASGGLEFAIRPPGILLSSSAPASASLRRFAATPTAAPLGRLSPGRFASLNIPADSAPQPWHAVIHTSGQVTVCPL